MRIPGIRSIESRPLILGMEVLEIVQIICHWMRLFGHRMPCSARTAGSSPQPASTSPPKIWDTATGRTRHTLRGHNARLYSVAFNPDATRLVTASARPDGDRLGRGQREASPCAQGAHEQHVQLAAVQPERAAGSPPEVGMTRSGSGMRRPGKPSE